MTYTSRLPQIAAALPTRVDVAVKGGAELVEATAKADAPDRPPIGQGLVDAIHVEREGDAAYEVVAGDRHVFWGHFQEFGTARHGAQPFLLPALEANHQEILQIVRAALRNL